MKSPLRAKLKKRQKSTSLFFLLWTSFSVVSLLIVFVFSITQSVILSSTFEREAFRTVTDKGMTIDRAIRGEIPERFGDDYNAFVSSLALDHGVRVFVLDGEGGVIFPSVSENNPFSQLIDEHKRQLAEEGATWENQKFAVYSIAGGVVYGSILPSYGNSSQETYLYVFHSAEIASLVTTQTQGRLIWIALFVFIIAFAVSSAMAGLLARPINEMTEKAKVLAKGDFNVDFHGEDYMSEMVELAETLNFARDELSKADRMQKELIANVSHDFKTPLTMIKAYAEMIVEFGGDDEEKRNRNAQVIIDEADRLASLVSDVLDLSKIRSGIQELKRDLFDISAYLHEILARFDYLCQTQGYRFEVDIDEGLYTEADRLKIGQVMYNLIGNAVNYTGEDKRVSVALKKQDDVIRFAVSDTGKGIKQEELSTIWDRYYRSGETHKRPVSGTGLGLSIVKTVLERHGFAFGVDSKLGEGSTFYAVFPLKGEATDEDE
ncbi:MAG: HAMP domain-containing histidine kinase [Clostridia bacterium]|nr:HAMP domain-containing histidine kinase [Clostridia bacterium]